MRDQGFSSSIPIVAKAEPYHIPLGAALAGPSAQR